MGPTWPSARSARVHAAHVALGRDANPAAGFNLAKSNPNIQVKFQLVTMVIGAAAKFEGTVEPHKPILNKDHKLISNEGYEIKGTMSIPARGDKESGALLGHELNHLNNAAEYGNQEEGTPEGKEGQARAEEAEAEIRDDFEDESDNVCGAAADNAMSKVGGGRLAPGLNQYMDRADERKKELEKQGKW